MAVTRTVNMLPAVFQTETNKKFLNATLDQLVTEPQLKRINGYIGRKFSPTYKSGDSYIAESTALRANYQLEPSVTVKNHDSGEVEFHASYLELLQKLKFHNTNISNQSELWENDYYSFNPRIDLDKFINFGQYYWLPNGPDTVDVYAGTVDLETSFVVTADDKNTVYNFSKTFQVANPDIILARGGTYEFVVNQPGQNFWIQSNPGISGVVPNRSNQSSRDVLGVSNNGTDNGVVTFAVPTKDAQDFYISLAKLQDIDFVTSLSYVNIQGQNLTEFIANHGGIDSQTTALDNRYLIFGTDYLDDVYWTVGVDTVPVSQRYGVWQIKLVDDGAGDFNITLNFVQDIPMNTKVNVKSGLVYGGTEWYKNSIGKLVTMPLITANLDVLYYQDSLNPEQTGVIRLVEPGSDTIDVDQDILGKASYISPNGVLFTNGLKVRFDASVVQTAYVNNEYYVEGVGTSIRLVPVTDLEIGSGELSINSPDYTAINRSSSDNNPWSRHNRWFHKEVVRLSAQYNNTVPVYDQNMLAKRPIIEFEPDLRLYNFGYNKKLLVDIFDTTVTNPFITVEGTSAIYLDGVALTDGMRVIFAADPDDRTRNKIWVVNFEDITDANPDNNNNRIVLTLASDGDSVYGDTVVISNGVANNGKPYWFDGSNWIAGQNKTQLHQAPLFDVFDSAGYSFGNNSKYPSVGSSGFAGNKIFSYGVGTGTADPVLGFPLAYKNFNQIGDIKFDNNFDSDEFSYVIDSVAYTSKINSGLLKKRTPSGVETYVNTWEKVNRVSTTYQNFSYEFDGINNSFYVDVQPKAETTTPNLIVYANATKLTSRQWRKINAPNGGFRVYVATNFINKGDRIDIFVNSDSVSAIGFYQVPPNLDLNAENRSFTEITLGTMRNHVSSLVTNSLKFSGKFPGISNLRDIKVVDSIGSIFQHSAPATFASLFLANESTDLIDSLNYASQEYTRFKNKFLEIAVNDASLNFADIPGCVDHIIKKLNSVKNKTFPWYYSDMVPYNDQRTVIEYNIFNPAIKRYEITNIFNDSELSNLAIIVYLNGTQLIKGRDYTFNQTSPAIELSSDLVMAVNDTLKIVEYTNTDGCWVPETPTKLGLYPKFVPEIYLDDSYLTATSMIRGHDGSLTPAFGDFRDSLLIELETRIYNNIKVPYNSNDFDLYDVIPGKFRNTGTVLNDFNLVLSNSFMRWVGTNRLNYSENSSYSQNNELTWNYRASPDVIDGELLPGTWRSCFQYFYDTQYPNLRPWEMLGFSERPSWWISTYGPAPYTSGNTILWTDLQNGYIAGENRYDANFARPGLLNFIPVNENGEMLSPYGLLSTAVNPQKTQLSFVFGNYGPAETAWRNSSEYPFAIQAACALSKPAKYFGLNINKQKYKFNSSVGQHLVTDTNQRITASDVVVHGTVNANSTVSRSSGYLNWIGDYQRHFGIDPTVVLAHYIHDYSVQLSYRMAGYSDKKYLKVYAEQHSPNSVNESIIIPDSDFDLIVNKSTPVQKVVYSAVIIEKSAGGYKVSGYDTTRPYFIVVPPDQAGKSYDISVLDETATIYSNFKSFKVTVPYGYEFSTKQQVVNFLTGYGLALTAVGFKFNNFDQSLGEIRNWTLSAKEFLFWTKQKWNTGSVLVLSPIGSELTLNSSNSVVDRLDNSIFGSRIVNQNFETLTSDSYSATRAGNLFSVKANNNQTICLADLNLVQYEHALIFKNTTSFADTIYQPELGSRQFRLKLAGFKTDLWTGNLDPQGFIYNSTSVADWQAVKDYLKGDLIQYKGLYYVANENIPGSPDFNFSKWKQIDKNNIKTGLLNNFATNSKISQQFYDVDGVNLESQFDLFGKGLIGYRNRAYLNDLDLDDTSQVKFYQGFIKSKGTLNALDALAGLASNNIAGDITFKEEWAFRVGEYGALETNQFIETDLTDAKLTSNPVTVQFTSPSSQSLADVVVTNPYKFSAQLYDPTIFLNRASTSEYLNDLQLAGFVHRDDVDYTIFDLGDYATLNADVNSIGSGTLIWCAKDFQSDWNVYRVSESQVQVISIQSGLDNILTIKTNNPHGLAKDDVVLIKSANQFTGFYKISTTPTLSSFTVTYTGSLLGFQGLNDLSSQLLYLHSVKFDYASEIADFIPRDGWRTVERAWVKSDINNKWAVYEKSEPWISASDLTAGETVENGNFGASVALGKNNNFAVVGKPGVDTGYVISYVLGFDNQLVEDSVITPFANNTLLFGSVLGQGADFTVAGAPGSASGQGYAYVLKRLPNSNLVVHQVLASPDGAAGDGFGTAVAMSDDDQWMYISSPSADKVYVYGYRYDTIPALYTITGNDSNTVFTLGFEPESAESIAVIGNGRTYVPNLDYTVSGNHITFTSPLAAGSCAIQQYAGYRYVTTITGESGSNFGASLATTTDGAQVIIGAPLETVNGLENAGTVSVYDRSIESFTVSGTEVLFSTNRPQTTLSKVLVNGVLQGRSNTSAEDPTYERTVDPSIIEFFDPLPLSSIVTIESNSFNLISKLTADSPSNGSQFGYSVDICPSNCSIYIGSPYYDGTTYNTGAVYRFVNQGRVYGNIVGTVQNPTVISGDSIRLDDFEIIFNETSLTAVVNAINNHGIPGISASQTNGYLTINSDSVISADKLRILPGRGTALESLGLNVFAQVQIINHPLAKADEVFGQKVRIDDTGKVLLVGSTVATTYEKTTFDSSTTIVDHSVDNFVDPMSSTGAIYVLNYLGDYRNSIDHAGRFVYNQQLDPITALSADGKFAADFMLKENQILVGASYDSKVSPNGGRVYQFNNVDNLLGWDTIRTQQDKVELSSILKFYLFDKKNHVILDSLDYIDPAKGKILGLAEQEITFKTSYDPARYNSGTDTATTTVSTSSHWSAQQVGKVWWDLSTVRFIDYEQDSLVYRSANWGSVFPGSSIDVYEWVESSVVPSLYATSVGDGVPKYADDSAYVTVSVFDAESQQTVTKYYFWVSGKTSVPSSIGRNYPVSVVRDLIENPKGQGVKFVAPLQNDSVALYNIKDDVYGKETILHIDYSTVEETGVIHTEWALVGENSADLEVVPNKIYYKIIDSLSGIDQLGNPVPDPLLPVQQRYGIDVRPRQSMFINRPAAGKVVIEYLNNIFSQLRLRETADLSGLYYEEPIPSAGTSEYDLIVPNFETLGYINIIIQPVGYKVLVQNDINANGLWTIYTKTPNNTWFLSRVQAFKVSEYWEFVNWFATGYDDSVVPDYVVDITADLSTLSLKTGDIVKIKNDGTGNWKLVKISPLLVETIGIQNGTINLKTSLYDSQSAGYGYDNDTFDTIRFDQNPSLEIRALIGVIVDQILINELSPANTRLIFVLMNYILNEQKYIDWAFKTSFVSVLHKLRKLNQPATYVKDNQDYYQQYIEEVKPYRTTIREYVLGYEGVDNVNGYVTDFDLPAYYDPIFNTYRSPSGEYSQDTSALQNPAYSDWKNHYSYSVSEIIIADGGTGYTIPPIVTITGSYTNNNATGRAIVNVGTGKVTSIILDNPGSDYTSIPVVTLTGGTGTGARAYAILTNGLVRSINTTLKFDRITYGTTVKAWEPNTVYVIGDLITFNNVAYQAVRNFTSGATFDGNNLAVYNSENLTTANDRIKAYYAPTANLPGLDFAQLQSGIDYPGVQILGPLFSYNPSFDSSIFDSITYDSFEIGPDGTIQLNESILDTTIQSQFTDLILGTRPEDINVDGGAYVDTFSSHAPEELVPGIVYDTLDLQVYQTITPDLSKEYQSVDIQFIAHKIVDANRTFAYKSPNFNDVLFVYTYLTGTLTEGSDYTVDYFSKTITVTKNLVVDDVLIVYSFNQVGENKINEVSARADGIATSFDTHMPYNLIGQCLVMVNGETVTNYTLTNTFPNATIVFDTAPAADSFVHIINYRTSQTFSEIHSKVYEVTSLAPAYPADYTITTDRNIYNEVPLDSHLIVELNNRRLRPATNVYYTAEPFRTIYAGPTSAADINADTVLNTDIKVYVNHVLLVQGVDYTVPPSTLGSPNITLTTAPAAGSIICIAVTKFAEFELTSSNVILLSHTLNLGTNDKIKVISFSNHDQLGIETTTYVGNQTVTATVTVGYSTIPFDGIGYDSNATATTVKPEFAVNTTITNQNYCWITLNGKRLIPNYDFEINGRVISLSDSYPLSATDVLIVTTFSKQTMGQPLGFRIFKDIVGNVDYLRISRSAITELAQELLITDTEVVVVDASVLPDANPTIARPGVILINGERITYYQIDLNTNTLSQLRRGTSGTGASDHPVGSRVVDFSTRQRVPFSQDLQTAELFNIKEWNKETAYQQYELVKYSDTVYQVTVDFTSSTSFDTSNLTVYNTGDGTTFSCQSLTATDFDENVNFDSVEVFVGGIKLANSEYTLTINSTLTVELNTALPTGVQLAISIRTGNIWYTPVPGVSATDGLGIETDDTPQALFLKAEASFLP